MYFVCTWWIFFLHSLDVIAKWYTKVFYLILSQQHENEINEAPPVIKNCKWSIKMPWLITLTAMGQNNDKQTLWYTSTINNISHYSSAKSNFCHNNRVQRKLFLQLAIRASSSQHLLGPDVISTSPKNFLTSRIDFTVLLLFEFLKKHHLPVGQVKNRIH